MVDHLARSRPYRRAPAVPIHLMKASRRFATTTIRKDRRHYLNRLLVQTEERNVINASNPTVHRHTVIPEGRAAWRSNVTAVVALTAMLLIGGVVTSPAPAFAAAPAPVDLASAAAYSVFSGLSVANTVTGPVTTLRGDLGVSVAGANAGTIAGFPPGVVVGETHNGDPQAGQAYTDLERGIRRCPGSPIWHAVDWNPGRRELEPGVYNFAGAFSPTGILTLDGQGDANAAFIFQVNGALAMAASAEVRLINEAQASRVFWQVNGAANLGANARLAGTVMAHDAIGLGAGAISTVVPWRSLARSLSTATTCTRLRRR